MLTVRQKDQAFEQIIAPPQGAAAQAAGNQAALQTTNLIQFQNHLLSTQAALVTAWQQYQLARLILYRDLGTLPYDEWEAFSELFPAEYHSHATSPPETRDLPELNVSAPPTQGVGR